MGFDANGCTRSAAGILTGHEAGIGKVPSTSTWRTGATKGAQDALPQGLPAGTESRARIRQAIAG